jgi:hypothetical protein
VGDTLVELESERDCEILAVGVKDIGDTEILRVGVRVIEGV